jgi:hypothetical protein
MEKVVQKPFAAVRFAPSIYYKLVKKQWAVSTKQI